MPAQDRKNSVPDWLRWIVCLPASIIAYIAVQYLVAFANSFVPLPGVIIDIFCQFANSIAGPVAFIHVGVKIAPSKKVAVSIVLALLVVVASLVIGVFGSIGHGFSLKQVWYWVCILIGVLAAYSYCSFIHDMTKKEKDA